MLPVSINSFAQSNCEHNVFNINASLSIMQLRVNIVTFSFSLCASALSFFAMSIPNVAGDIIPLII